VKRGGAELATSTFVIEIKASVEAVDAYHAFVLLAAALLATDDDGGPPRRIPAGCVLDYHLSYVEEEL
jgi:hypothetical protein